MGKKKQKIVFVCDKCGKAPPIDAEASSNNWVVYKVKEPCGCGGHWGHKIVEINNAT